MPLMAPSMAKDISMPTTDPTDARTVDAMSASLANLVLSIAAMAASYYDRPFVAPTSMSSPLVAAVSAASMVSATTPTTMSTLFEELLRRLNLIHSRSRTDEDDKYSSKDENEVKVHGWV